MPFKVHTDASTSSLGAVLYQQQDGIDRVNAYASRSLKPAERNYPAHKLEFLAMKWAITDKFHDYLYGVNFEVVTDNNPLTYVFTSAKLDASGHRWVAALANYIFFISYRSGKLNMVPDGLSRLSEGSLSERVVYPDVLKAVQNQCHKADSHEPHVWHNTLWYQMLTSMMMQLSHLHLAVQIGQKARTMMLSYQGLKL